MNESETQQLARRHLEGGYAHQRAGRLGYAMQAYRQAIALCPTVEAHTRLGWALANLGRYDEAIEQARLAIALDPDDGDPYQAIGAWLIEQERWDEAQPWLELALSAPRCEARRHAQLLLGRAHGYFGRHREARARFEAVLADDPEFRAARHALQTLIAAMN